jgi:hypothetical protein
VIIGPNGTAKTTVLQAIALAAAGSLQANGLAKPVVGHLADRRGGRKTTEIDVDFRFSTRGSDARFHPLLGRSLAKNERLRSTVTLEHKQSTLLGTSAYVGSRGTLRCKPAPLNPSTTPAQQIDRFGSWQATELVGSCRSRSHVPHSCSPRSSASSRCFAIRRD